MSELIAAGLADLGTEEDVCIILEGEDEEGTCEEVKDAGVYDNGG